MRRRGRAAGGRLTHGRPRADDRRRAAGKTLPSSCVSTVCPGLHAAFIVCFDRLFGCDTAIAWYPLSFVATETLSSPCVSNTFRGLFTKTRPFAAAQEGLATAGVAEGSPAAALRIGLLAALDGPAGAAGL